MKKVDFIIIALVLIIVGCEQNTKKRINCICFIDYSSSLAENTLDNYVHIISNDLMKNLNRFDRLIVLPIDEGAKLEPVKLINEDFSKMNFSKQTDGFTHAQDSIIKRIHDYVDKRTDNLSAILKLQKENRKRFANQTNIVGAIEQAKILLETSDEDTFLKGVGRFISGKNRISTENIVVLFSDMINESDDLNFARPGTLSESNVNRLLSKLHSEGKIPNLKGVKVFVTGRTGKSNQQVERIQNFWEKYFELTEAKLMAYSYDVGDEITQYLKTTLEVQ